MATDVTQSEFARLLAKELQLPRSYGDRLAAAYSAVLTEIFEEGKSVNLGPVTIGFTEFNSRNYTQSKLYGKRRRMFKFNIKMTTIGKAILERLTDRKYDDV